nr:Dam family site-specific DNA-(adenine-N6)-methyltransferase [uncultured Sphaerochaeta sp.]
MIPALLKWIGNKGRYAEEIVSYMPNSINTYYEPFLGSGAVLGELLDQTRKFSIRSCENSVASDILPFLVDIFMLVKDQPDELIEYYKEEIVNFPQNCKDAYEIVRDRFNRTHNAKDFCILSRTCYSGIIRFRKSDGYMSTPVGPHMPISGEAFEKRVRLWHSLISQTEFVNSDFKTIMAQAKAGDVVYCDPPYTHSQTIIYGAQDFKITELWNSIRECKARGAKVLLSINGSRESGKRQLEVEIPQDLFIREIPINCGISMIDRLQNEGKNMINEKVHDRLLLTY